MDKKIIFIIFILSFVVRILRFDYPMSGVFAWGDGTRDYLVASHIVKYQEFPLVGPYNLLDDKGVKNNPSYFYVLALPLLLFNHPLTLAVFNIFLQMASLVLVYLIAKAAFNRNVALVALIFFSFNPEVIKFADYIWQPYSMMPLALLGLYLLIRGYPVLSLVAVSMSFAMHSSGFPYLAAIFMAGFKHYLRLALATALTLAIYFLLPELTLSGYLNNLNSNLDIFLKAFSINKLFLTVLIAALLYRCKPKILFFSILFFLPILFASLFNKIRLHYLILSFPSFAILTAGLAGNIPSRPLKLLLVLSLAIIFSGNLQFLKELKTPLESAKFIDNVTEKLARDLISIKGDFQVKSYALDKSSFDYPLLDTILLVPLERKLNMKLAAVSDNSYNHQQISQKDYLVLACFRFTFPSSDCRDIFLKKNPEYEVIKISFTNEYISLYLTKLKAIAKY